ncbi:MAG: hypothetical protein P8X70_00580 [Nanoarchaeota archaeon]
MTITTNTDIFKELYLEETKGTWVIIEYYDRDEGDRKNNFERNIVGKIEDITSQGICLENCIPSRFKDFVEFAEKNRAIYKITECGSNKTLYENNKVENIYTTDSYKKIFLNSGENMGINELITSNY